MECINLVDQAQSMDPTRAESVKTAQVTDIALAYGLSLLDAAVAQDQLPTEPRRVQEDARYRAGYGSKKVTGCPPWTLYAERGRDPRVHQLSAFEFARHYHYQQASQPWTLAQEEREPDKYQVRFTEAGKAKLARGAARSKLAPAIDYHIKEQGGVGWLPLGHGERAQPYRHDWVIVVRKRPLVPVIYGAQGCRTEEEQAQKIMLLFCPWTTNAADATADVPFVADLMGGCSTWRDALTLWFSTRGFATESLRRYVRNFCFVYCLPRELQSNGDLAENSDNEGIEDRAGASSPYVGFCWFSTDFNHIPRKRAQHRDYTENMCPSIVTYCLPSGCSGTLRRQRPAGCAGHARAGQRTGRRGGRRCWWGSRAKLAAHHDQENVRPVFVHLAGRPRPR